MGSQFVDEYNFRDLRVGAIKIMNPVNIMIKLLLMNSNPKTNFFQAFFQDFRQKSQLLGETRSLILFWYLFMMVFFMGLSIPIFSELVLQEIKNMAKQTVTEKGQALKDKLNDKKINNEIVSREDFQEFFDNILMDQIPDEDVFFVAIIADNFYRSSPQAIVPKLIPVDSQIMQHWVSLKHEEQGTYVTNSPSLGEIIYFAQPVINKEGKVKGVFIVAHLTAIEIKEANILISIVIRVLVTVFILALILTWLASGKILSPLRSLISTAKIISDANLDQRLPIKGSGEMAELAKTFNDMMDRLKRSFTTQKTFINDAGHELKTPITIIRGHLELLEDDPQEREETLALVFDELDRMNRMVQDLLLLAKSEQPDFLQLETVNINVFIQEIFTKTHTLADRNWQLRSQATGIIKGDRHRLTQAMFNLVKNATEHTQKGDLIEIGSKIENNYLYLWVRDTGEGIIEDEQERIFERFARVDKQARRSDGFGLGLSIVKVIAQAHKGRIELVSQVGIGSTFTLVIPK